MDYFTDRDQFTSIDSDDDAEPGKTHNREKVVELVEADRVTIMDTDFVTRAAIGQFIVRQSLISYRDKVVIAPPTIERA